MIGYLVHYFLFFFLPGCLLASLSGFGRFSFVLALPLSYFLLIVNLMAGRAFAVPVDSLALAIYGQIGGIALLWIIIRRRQLVAYLSIPVLSGRVSRMVAAKPIDVAICICLFTVISLYLVFAGPYTEVPSDFWWHVGVMQREYLTIVDTGVLAPIKGWLAYLGKQGAWWYAIQAMMMQLSGITVAQSLAGQGFVNTLVLLIAYFWFAVRVLEWSRIDHRAIFLVAALAMCFYVFHHGTNIFAFVRYYTFGPVFLNQVVLFAFLVLLLDFLRDPACRRVTHVVAAVIMMMVMTVVHLQEALFAGVLGYCVFLVVWFQRAWASPESLVGYISSRTILSTKWLTMLVCLATSIIVVGGLYMHMTLPRHDPLATGRLIEIRELVPFLRNMFVLDPTWQFYETFTAWGYLVLVLFFLRFNTFRSNPILVAGMLSPFLTVFNPLFNDLFLRVAVPWVLWRLLFITPLAIVGALLMYRAIGAARQRGPWVIRGGAAAIVVLLVALLFPLQGTFVNAEYSRMHSLKPVLANNDHRHWSDLFEYLNTLDRSYKVMTDPVTGYMLRALTPHRHNGWKFDTTLSPGYRALVQGEYSTSQFKRFRGTLIVLNRRAGGHSLSGEISRHWLPHQLDLPRYYPEELIEFITRHPALFEKRWHSGDIQVFEIT